MKTERSEERHVAFSESIYRNFMSQWRRLPFVLMALFALCALTLPSLTWACPLAARGADVARICSATSKQSAVAMPCCAPDNSAQMPLCKARCCELIPQLPTENSDKNTALPQAHAEFSGLLAQLSGAAHAIAVPVLAATPLAVEPPLAVHWPDETVLISPTQIAPGALLGRAPPRL